MCIRDSNKTNLWKICFGTVSYTHLDVYKRQVQDRDTGIIIEEKISAHVKLGMRIIYNGKSPESKKFRSLLKTLSVRQGKKFDSTASAKQIEPFIKFHSLDLSQCRDEDFKTFNDFFYRKLKPGSRLPESTSKEILFSPADSRCTVFSTIQESKEIWIKGRKFSIKKLANNYSPEIFNDSGCSIGTVSYTHLDVYKRQLYISIIFRIVITVSDPLIQLLSRAIINQVFMKHDILPTLGEKKNINFIPAFSHCYQICLQDSKLYVHIYANLKYINLTIDTISKNNTKIFAVTAPVFVIPCSLSFV